MRKRVNVGIGLALAAAMSTALAGCDKSATGQVVAVANGDEITLPELNAELAGANLPANANKEQARAAALQRIVERRLVAQQAKADGLDRDPEYLIRQRQLNDTLLAELYAKRAQDTIRVPDQAAIDRFIAQNPGAFAQRSVLSVDQIRFGPQGPDFGRQLAPLRTLDEIAALLKSRGIAFDRRPSKIDSAQVDAKTLAQVEALPAGEPFVVVTPQGAIASVVTGREAVRLPAEQARPMAAQMIRSQSLGTLLQNRLKDIKAKAEVEYQPGFAPPAAGAAPKAAAAKG